MAFINLLLGFLDKLLGAIAPYLKPKSSTEKDNDAEKKLRDGFDEAEKTGRPPK